MIFKQLITNLGIHCALKISGCQSFCGFMYPLKMNHKNFTLEGTLKKYAWEPWDSGNIQHCIVFPIKKNSRGEHPAALKLPPAQFFFSVC